MTDNTHNDPTLTLDELSARREKLGLSLADMANRIKVSREIIRYIEDGEFNRIGSATFIRGHVGNYARELGLDPQTILALVPAQHLKPYEPKLSSSKVSNPLSRVKTHSGGFGRYVLGTFLVAALGLSFYFVYDKWDSHQTGSDLLLVEQDNRESVDAVGNKKKVIYSSLLPQADMISEDNTFSHQTNNSEPQQETDILSEGFDNQEIEEPTGSETVDNPDNELSQSQETELTETQARYAIRFDLSEQAWVSIKTDSGQTIVSDLIGPGNRQYQSDEPLHFRIGNANQLTLYINDEMVDLTTRSRQNVANFEWPPTDG